MQGREKHLGGKERKKIVLEGKNYILRGSSQICKPPTTTREAFSLACSLMHVMDLVDIYFNLVSGNVLFFHSCLLYALRDSINVETFERRTISNTVYICVINQDLYSVRL